MSQTEHTQSPTISLIIPAYNEEKYLGECLSFVRTNAGSGLCEILVIDNASTDTTADVASMYSGVTVIREERKGLTFARQCGYENAKGDILAYIDADTRMPKGWVDLVRSSFTANSELACISGPYEYYDTSYWGKQLVSAFYLMAKPAYWVLGYMATGGNFAIRKSVVTKMGGFDTSIAFYGEDTDIAKRAHEFGRVLFTSALRMPTSARRFHTEGLITIGYRYLVNFISISLLGRSSTEDYIDVR